MSLYKTLLALALTLLMASAASAQSAAGSKHRRYDPARPVYYDPYFQRLYRNHHSHGRHHDRRDDHGRFTDSGTSRRVMDEAIAQAFVAARRRLQPEHHSRLVKAWELVVERAVIDNADGSHTVKGVDQPEYLVDPSGCTCTDCTSGKAPLGLCKHVLAAALQKRSIQKFQDMAEALAKPPVPSDPLPEAPISICLKGTLGGVAGTMVTLRGHTMAEIEARADEVKAGAWKLTGIFDDAPAASETSTAVVAVPTCPDHGTPMKPSKFGGWYCPQATGDAFCKRKIAAAKRAPFVPPAAYQPGFRG